MKRLIWPVCIIILIVVALFYVDFTIPENIAIDVNSLPAFGFLNNETNDYFLTDLHVYPNRPFIYCDFVKGSKIPGDDGFSYSEHVALLDIEKGKCILRAKWQGHGASSLFGIVKYGISDNRIASSPMQYSNGTPFILLWECENNHPAYSRMDLDGKIHPLPDLQIEGSNITAIPGTNRLLVQISNRCEEYEINQEGAHKVRQWDNIAVRAFNKPYAIGDKAYLISDNFTVTLCYRDDSRTVRSFPITDLFQIASLKYNQKEKYDYRISVIPSWDGQSAFIQLNSNGSLFNTLFDIYIDPQKNESASDVFHCALSNYQQYPSGASNSLHRIYGMPYNRNPELQGNILVYEREKNPDGSWEGFPNSFIKIPVNAAIRNLCQSPISPERLLYYDAKKQSLWTVDENLANPECVYPKN